jgi:hypothetical protein
MTLGSFSNPVFLVLEPNHSTAYGGWFFGAWRIRFDYRVHKARNTGFLHAIGQTGAAGAYIRVPGRSVTGIGDGFAAADTDARFHSDCANFDHSLVDSEMRRRPELKDFLHDRSEG